MKKLNHIMVVIMVTLSLVTGVVQEVYAQDGNPVRRRFLGWAITDYGSATYNPDTGCWTHTYYRTYYVFWIGVIVDDEETESTC